MQLWYLVMGSLWFVSNICIDLRGLSQGRFLKPFYQYRQYTRGTERSLVLQNDDCI